MKKYKDACGKLMTAYHTLPAPEQDNLRSRVRAFVEQKFLEAGMWKDKGEDLLRYNLIFKKE